MIEKVRAISFGELRSESEYKRAFRELLNVVEDLCGQIEKLKRENQDLRDELSRLKGGNEKPKFEGGGNSEEASRDWSSKNSSRGNSGVDKERGKKGEDLKITVVKIYDEVPEHLPLDAYKIGCLERVQQELRIEREVVLYKISRWYSPSMGKTYSSPTGDLLRGGYGSGVQSFMTLLHHYGDMTQSKLKGILGMYGINISTGTISDILNRAESWVKKERRDILETGILLSPYIQSDSTQSKESGNSLKTHVFGSDSFSVFYTTLGKSRLDLLLALQDMPEGGLDLSYNEQSQRLLLESPISDKHLPSIAAVFEGCGESACDLKNITIKISEFDNLLAQQDPELAQKPTVVKRIKESLALGHYWTQTDMPVLNWLLTDNAPEYRTLARAGHGLCWVHDARNYTKLMPKTHYFETILNGFLEQYWQFYHQLLHFKKQPAIEQVHLRIALQAEFVQLFNTKTPYDALNDWIQHSLNCQEKLLAVLINPALPLHNNAAELAARRIVRKRDISLHTMSKAGTDVRDGFLYVIQSAQKMAINPLQYIVTVFHHKHQLRCNAERRNDLFESAYIYPH